MKKIPQIKQPDEPLNLNKAQAMISISGAEYQLKNRMSWRAVSKAARMCLTWFMVNAPTKLEDLYFDCIDKKKIDKIGSTMNPVIVGTGCWRIETIYHAFDNYLSKNEDLDILRAIVEQNAELHAVINKTIPKIKTLDSIEKDIFIQKYLDGNSELTFAFMVLELYINDIQSAYMDAKICAFENIRMNERIHMTEYCFGLHDFYDDAVVKKNVDRLEKILNDYAMEKYKMPAKKVFLNIFEKQNGFGHYFPIKQFNLLPEHLAALNSQEFGNIILSPGFDPEFMNTTIDLSIYNVCYGYIEAYFEKEYSQKLSDFESQSHSCLNVKPFVPEESESILNCKSTDINKAVRKTSPSELFLSVLWEIQALLASIPDRTEKTMDFNKKLSESGKLLDKKNNEIISLRKQRDQLNSMISSLNQQISVQNEKIQSFEKTVAVNEVVLERDEKIRQLERNIDNLKKDLEKEKTKNAKLLQESQSKAPQPSEAVEEERMVDVTKKYLFVVCHDQMKGKLMTWFPNCVISDGKDVRASANYYMAVFITKSLSHAEYNRIKPMCINNHIPMANCNVINFDRICETIRQCEDEYNLI